MVALLTLLIVGLMISSWIAGGIVPAMIYYGLKIITPGAFLVTACILALIVAMSTGSSWTTLGTIGVALIGIGNAMGFDPGMTAGAAIVGAYAGDKMSPLSDTTLMAPAVSGTNVFSHIRHRMVFISTRIMRDHSTSAKPSAINISVTMVWITSPVRYCPPVAPPWPRM